MNTTVSPAAGPAPVRPASQEGLTRCWVVWTNGWKKAFRSYDTSGRYQVDDPRAYGIRGLKKMVARWGPNVSQAIIYDNATGLEITRLQNGAWVDAQ